MSDHAFDFLQSWVVENVKAMIYEDSAEHLAHDWPLMLPLLPGPTLPRLLVPSGRFVRVKAHVRFTPKSGHWQPTVGCPLCARRRHWRAHPPTAAVRYRMGLRGQRRGHEAEPH
jgi:hypothetical protein